MYTRRNFLKSTSILAVGSMILPNLSCLGSTNFPYGLILYTVRGEMAEDPMSTLRSVSEIGYQALEGASYSNRQMYGMKPSEFKHSVESFGMTLLSNHVNVTEQNVYEVAEDAAEAGLKFVVQPSMEHNSLDDFKRGAERYNKFGKIFNDQGIRFGYHNHAFEFLMMDGVVPYDLLLEQTDPNLVCMQLDLYWIIKGGADPLEYFNKYPGRFELWHVKDMSANTQQYETELGNGVIDFEEIFSQSEKAGLKNYFVEQDNCRDYSPLESIGISLEYLKEIGQ